MKEVKESYTENEKTYVRVMFKKNPKIDIYFIDKMLERKHKEKIHNIRSANDFFLFVNRLHTQGGA